MQCPLFIIIEIKHDKFLTSFLQVSDKFLTTLQTMWSQIFDKGPSFDFIKCRNCCLKEVQKVTLL